MIHLFNFQIAFVYGTGLDKDKNQLMCKRGAEMGKYTSGAELPVGYVQALAGVK